MTDTPLDLSALQETWLRSMHLDVATRRLLLIFSDVENGAGTEVRLDFSDVAYFKLLADVPAVSAGKVYLVETLEAFPEGESTMANTLVVLRTEVGHHPTYATVNNRDRELRHFFVVSQHLSAEWSALWVNRSS